MPRAARAPRGIPAEPAAPVRPAVRAARVIVWRASYPRSGNTLLRLVFGTLPASEYPEQAGDAERVRLGLAIKLPYDGAPADLRAAARHSAEPVFIKTHGPPPDDEPAIYILRDGRAARSPGAAFAVARRPGFSLVCGAIRVAGGGGWACR